MAHVIPKSTIELEITLKISESEARALEAMIGYGADSFMKVFYNHMGKHYLGPHEHGMREFFKTINSNIHAPLAKIDRAREAFNKAEGHYET